MAFAPWVGTLVIETKQPLLMGAPIEREEEAILQLARVGYHATSVYLKGGFDAWKSSGTEYDKVNVVLAEQLEDLIPEKLSFLM